MAINIEDLATLAATTIDKYHRGVWTDDSLPYTEYPGYKFFFEMNNMTQQAGPKIKFPYRYRNTGNFSVDGGAYAEAHETIAQNNLIYGEMKWARLLASYLIDSTEEEFQSSDEVQIVSILKERIHGSKNDFVEGFEPLVWTSPASSTEKRPLGIPSYVVKSTSTGGSFAGGNPSGFSSGVAGIDSSTYTTYRNWAGGYSQVTPEDLIHKMRLAMENTSFDPPFKAPSAATADKRVIFTTTASKIAVQELLTKQNDNLGGDAMPYATTAMIKSVMTVKVPYLDDNVSDEPFYGINFSTLRPVYKTGHKMKVIAPEKVDTRRFNQRVAYFETFMGLECVQRRNQWVLSK
jgi:hypothetical protein